MTGRGMVAAVVLAAWGAGIAVFAQREASRSPAERLAEAAVRVSPSASYYAITANGRHTGFSSFTTDTVPDGLQFTEYAVIDARDGGAGRQVRQVVTRASRTLALREVVVRAGATLARAVVRDDSTLLVIAELDGRADTTTRGFTRPLLVPSLVALAIALGPSPTTGDRHAYDVFDPATLRVRRLHAQVRAESTWVIVDSASYDGGSSRWRSAHADTVRAWHVVEDGQRADGTWVDELGRMVAAERSGVGTLRRTAYEIAFENWRASARGVGAPVTGTAPPKLPMGDGSRRRTMEVVTRGLPLAQLGAASIGQEVSGDTVRIKTLRADGAANGYWLPPHRDFRSLFARELQVEPGIEVGAPGIVGASKALRAREPDPTVFARALTSWISDSVQYESTLAPPSALSTWRSRAGDAEHHTVLYVALARASGLPARPVRGVVRVADRWRPHAWAEVWLAGQWLPVDPTTGQFPADASHFRLTVGGIGAEAELNRLVSRATLSVVETPLVKTRVPRDPQ